MKAEFAQEAPDPLQQPQAVDESREMALEQPETAHAAPVPGRTREFGQESGDAVVKVRHLSYT